MLPLLILHSVIGYKGYPDLDLKLSYLLNTKPKFQDVIYNYQNHDYNLNIIYNNGYYPCASPSCTVETNSYRNIIPTRGYFTIKRRNSYNIIDTEEYFFNGMRHRIDGPAVIKQNDSFITEEYYNCNRLHRRDSTWK